MKIGILTQPLQNNYGGLLQNYALQQVLLRAGHDVVTIDQGVPSIKRSIKEKMYGWILATLKPDKYSRPKYLPTDKEQDIIRKNTNAFINKYINHTAIMMSYQDFYDEAKKGGYDAYIVGSDQCWRPCFNPFLSSMFLDFVLEQQGIRRIAYAASLGTYSWDFDDKMTARCSELAKKFDLITVREKNAVALCEDNLGVKAYHVLDPTMLLDRSDYEEIVEKEKESNHSGQLFYYILDPSSKKTSLIKQMQDELEMVAYTVMPKRQAENRTKSDVKERIEDCIFPTVTNWLRGFMDARMVVVDSFHGAVFSIIFNKPFWIIANEGRGNARFDSLLQLFNLENRFIETITNNNINWMDPIDWASINRIMEEKRRESLELLFKYLR